jgi:hypothetical protein
MITIGAGPAEAWTKNHRVNPRTRGTPFSLRAAAHDQLRFLSSLR